MFADIICTDVSGSDSSQIHRGYKVGFFIRDEYETICEADREFSLLIETYLGPLKKMIISWF